MARGVTETISAISVNSSSYEYLGTANDDTITITRGIQATNNASVNIDLLGGMDKLTVGSNITASSQSNINIVLAGRGSQASLKGAVTVNDAQFNMSLNGNSTVSVTGTLESNNGGWSQINLENGNNLLTLGALSAIVGVEKLSAGSNTIITDSNDTVTIMAP